MTTPDATDLRPTSPAWGVAARVVDPELPMLTLADLGVLRAVDVRDDGAVVVTITPTYSGCPAIAAMRADVARALAQAGYADVDVRLSLSPAWSSDDITDAGRRKLAAAGISPPGAGPAGPIALSLVARPRPVHCPRCGAGEAALTSEFGPTACTALYACSSCGEPFEHVKEI